ncbi:hypothetical protein V8C44DRAFT_368414 [Trichoderma aethiopicum]
MAYYTQPQEGTNQMVTNATAYPLAQWSELNAQDVDFQDMDFDIPMDDFESMWVNAPANNNGIGLNNNFGFNGQGFTNNQMFVNSNMVANTNWVMTPTLAAAPLVINSNNNNYTAMAGYMPMDTNLPMSNPMAVPLGMPSADTTMATGQFFDGAPDFAGASLTMAGNNVSAGPSTSIGMVAGPNTRATTGNIAMAMPTNPTMPAPAARPAARTSPARTPRPAGPRLSCTMCDEHPGGFRGRHELNRHVELKHNNDGTTYICLDPGNEATVGQHKIQLPFKKCKRCTGLKEYNSAQNAIDHLRRKHFIPKWHPGFKDADRVLPKQLPAKYFEDWVRTIGGTATTAPQPANQAPAVAPPPANQAPAVAPPPAPQAPVIAPPASEAPATTPATSVSSTDLESDATSSAASGENTVSPPPDTEKPPFDFGRLMYLSGDYCVPGEEETIDPPL